MPDNVKPDGGGLRYDGGKLRFDLFPPDALEELAKVYTMGAAKYAARNWERGQKYGVCFGAAMRHLWAWWRGEQRDKESGLHPLAHAAWNVLALLAYELRGMTDLDDRNHLANGSEAERTAPPTKENAMAATASNGNGSSKVYMVVFAVLASLGITGASWVTLNSSVAAHAARMDGEVRRVDSIVLGCDRRAEAISKMQATDAAVAEALKAVNVTLERIEDKLDAAEGGQR